MYNELIFRAKDGKERSQEEFFDAITRAFAEEGMDIDREDMRTALENAKQYRAIVHCKDCKHRPFINTGGVHIYPPRMRVEEPEDGYSHDRPDDTCPFLCDDEYYSRMPPDDFFCAYGEVKDEL